MAQSDGVASKPSKTMTTETRRMSGIIILTVPTIAYGGYFLLTILSGQADGLALTDFQKGMFRAGLAHACVLVMLSLLAMLFVDNTRLSDFWKWSIRISLPLAGILVSGGFFAAAIGQGLTKPNDFILILYLGVASLIFGLITLGIGLIRK
jgi:hypothetical protein